MNLKGKTAVVTGGAVRVGRALTLALAEAGCDLLIHYGRSAEAAQQTKTEAEAFGITAHTVSADLSSAAGAMGIMETAVSHFDRVDILINSAAVFPEADSFAVTDAALWDTLFGVNLRAPYLLSQAFAAQIAPDQRGKIINILDNRINRPATDHFVYRLTKGGLWQMTETMALELAPRIGVNGVALGAILPPPGESPAYLQKMAQEQIPLQIGGDTAVVADTVLHLLRHDFMTGAIVPLDGGQFL